MLLTRYRVELANSLLACLIRVGYHSKPRFLIIGAQKAGTTALYHYLAQHPNIQPPREKELYFFSPELFEDWPEHPYHRILCGQTRCDFFDPQIYPQAAAWYHSHFPLPHKLGGDRITYEATPEYLYYPPAAERIFKYDREMKLIAILRDPVERAYSAWNMYRSFGSRRPYVYAPRRETREFDVAVRDEINGLNSGTTRLDPGYVRRGLYYEQLLGYLQLFKREQILILDSRALKHNTSSVIEEVVNFLGLPEYRHQGGWSPYLVGAYETQIPAAIRCLLREFYRPHNEKLYELLDHDFDWQ